MSIKQQPPITIDLSSYRTDNIRVFYDGKSVPIKDLARFIAEYDPVTSTAPLESEQANKKRIVAKLRGIWSEYVTEPLSYEEIDEMTEGVHRASLERLLKKVTGEDDE